MHHMCLFYFYKKISDRDLLVWLLLLLSPINTKILEAQYVQMLRIDCISTRPGDHV